MRTVYVKYTTEPEWDGCGCCIYWDAHLHLVDADTGEHVQMDRAEDHPGYVENYIESELDLLKYLNANYKAIPGLKITHPDNTYFSIERDRKFEYGEE